MASVFLEDTVKCNKYLSILVNVSWKKISKRKGVEKNPPEKNVEGVCDIKSNW